MIKLKIILCLAVITILDLQLCACQQAEAKENESVAEIQQAEAKESKDPISVWEKAANAMEEGNCYEITENSYIEGIDFDFSQEDIQQLRGILESKEMEYSEIIYEPEKAKYIMNFYDKDGNALISFVQLEDGTLYMDDGYQVSSKALEELFNSRIKEKQNLKNGKS